MKEYSEVFVGLDVSKLKISVAVAAGGRGGEIRFFGDIDASPAVVGSMVKKLAKPGVKLHFCYEAGPTGYELHRQIVALGHECVLVAPSLIPKRPGAGQNQPPGCLEPGQAAPCRRADAGMGSGSGA